MRIKMVFKSLVSSFLMCSFVSNCRFLGTFITEFDKGKEICRQLLSSDHVVDQVVDALVLLMRWYSFDGYLLNIENPIEVS